MRRTKARTKPGKQPGNLIPEALSHAALAVLRQTDVARAYGCTGRHAWAVLHRKSPTTARMRQVIERMLTEKRQAMDKALEGVA